MPLCIDVFEERTFCLFHSCLWKSPPLDLSKFVFGVVNTVLNISTQTQKPSHLKVLFSRNWPLCNITIGTNLEQRAFMQKMSAVYVCVSKMVTIMFFGGFKTWKSWGNGIGETYIMWKLKSCGFTQRRNFHCDWFVSFSGVYPGRPAVIRDTEWLCPPAGPLVHLCRGDAGPALCPSDCFSPLLWMGQTPCVVRPIPRNIYIHRPLNIFGSGWTFLSTNQGCVSQKHR